MNIKLLRQVQQAILAEPKKFDMNFFFANNSDSPCGTTACIAGHAAAIALKAENLKVARHRVYTTSSASEMGRAELGLSLPQADRLFYAYNWPEPFQAQYERRKKAESKARAAAARIDHFIKTKGRE